MSKFKVGDRVRVTKDRSSASKRLDGEVVTVTRVQAGYFYAGVGNDIWDNEAELVTKGGEVKPYQRKTYRLLKDTPETRKGALYQEACDDGTQEYSLITDEHKKAEQRGQWAYAERALVEDQPSWFVEVFKVQPEYMTQPELDEWEAFKSRKKPRGRRVELIQADIDKFDKPRTRRKKMTRYVSDRRIEEFADVWNHSYSRATVAKKMKLSIGTVHSYAAQARGQGTFLRAMPIGRRAA